MDKPRDRRFPDRETIVAFIRTHPGQAGTREIARAFNLKNADRVELKKILRDLANDGTIVKRGRKMRQAEETLPPTLMADITGRDSDGELLATPTEWDEEAGTPPKIRIHVPRRAKPGTTPLRLVPAPPTQVSLPLL